MKHPSLKEKAYELIKDKLLSLQFEPGTRIREDHIAENIMMSRTPVREAINRLVSEGLIKSIPRKGLFFIELTPDEINDLIDVRCQLEALAVTKCIEKINDPGLKKLENILKSADAALEKDDIKGCNKLDSQFHQEIAKATGNQKLIQFLKELENFMRIARAMEKRTLPRPKVEKSMEQHRQILEAIQKRDKSAALDAIARNVEQLRIHLIMKS
jgi:DNA-binding GntR family transcriptional regulator